MKSLQILNESPLDFVHIFPLHFIGKSFVEVFSLKCRGIYIFKKITKYFPQKFKGCYLFLHNSVSLSFIQMFPIKDEIIPQKLQNEGGITFANQCNSTRLHHKLAPQYLSYSRHAALVTSICMTDTIWIPAIQYVKDAEQTSILGFKFQTKIEKRVDTFGLYKPTRLKCRRSKKLG